jgi:hypothetical protein
VYLLQAVKIAVLRQAVARDIAARGKHMVFIPQGDVGQLLQQFLLYLAVRRGLHRQAVALLCRLDQRVNTG